MEPVRDSNQLEGVQGRGKSTGIDRLSNDTTSYGSPDRSPYADHHPRRRLLNCRISSVLLLSIAVFICGTVTVLAAPPSNKDSSSASSEVQVPYNPSIFSTVFRNVPYVKPAKGGEKETSKESSAAEDYESVDGYPTGFWTYLLRPGFAFQSDSQMKEVTNVTDDKAHEKGKCKDGLIIPAWRPLEPLSTGDRWARGIIYFLGLCYMFVGISIIADRFMAAIEVITSLERQVSIHTVSRLNEISCLFSSLKNLAIIGVIYPPL